MTREVPCQPLTGDGSLRLVQLGSPASHVQLRPRTKIDRTASPITLPPLQGASKQAIQELAKSVTVIFDVDDSGSMYGQFGDPSGIRYAAAQSLLRLQIQSGGGKAGVIHWGTDVPMDQVVKPIDVRREKKKLHRALRIPATLGGNDMPRSLEVAKEVLPLSRAGEVQIVFVITDGIESVTASTHRAVGDLPPGSVHLLLVDRSNYCTDELEDQWRQVAFGSFTRLERLDDTSTLAIQLGKIYAKALGLTLTPMTP